METAVVIFTVLVFYTFFWFFWLRPSSSESRSSLKRFVENKFSFLLADNKPTESTVDNLGDSTLQVTIDQLRRELALKDEEVRSVLAEHNDIELRRLKSELHSLRLESKEYRDTIRKLNAELQDKRLQAQASTVSHHQHEKESTVASDPVGKAQVLYSRPASQDDLKLINGIGPVIERKLNEIGISTFEQIAGFKSVDIERVTNALGAFSGRIERDKWIEQAKTCHRNHSEVSA